MSKNKKSKKTNKTRKGPSKESQARKQEEARAKADREQAARAKVLLNNLIYDLNYDHVGAASPPDQTPNVSLDFVSLTFLRNVVESDAYRAKVQEAIRQLDEQMVAKEVAA